MKFLLIGFLVAGFGLTAQTPRAAVKIDAPNRPGHPQISQVGTSIMGFVGGAGSSEFRAVLGIFGAARFSQPIAVPETVARLYLPARQHYALVEQSSDKPLALWNLDESVLQNQEAVNDGWVAIDGASPHPDLVAFSPRGESAALYFNVSRQLQIISGLPDKIAIKKIPLLASAGAITMMTLSDDAKVVVTKDAGGDLEIASGDTNWRPFYGGSSPLAWSFIPKTHDMVISDSQENAAFLIEQADSKNARVLLAPACRPDQLAVIGNGETLVALDSSRSALWTIDLKNRIASAVPSSQELDALTLLRNGNTVLVSSRNANPVLLKIPDGAAAQMSAVLTATAAGGH